MKKHTLLILLVALTYLSGSSFGQSVSMSTSLEDEVKPSVIVVSANYSLLFGYSFFIEHRGSKRTGNKELYKSFEEELVQMGNPSDAILFMNNSGYELLEVYSFPKGDDITTINYVFNLTN